MSIFLSKNGKSFFKKTQKVVLKHNAVKMDFYRFFWLHKFLSIITVYLGVFFCFQNVYKMETNFTKTRKKNDINIFNCEICQYKTSKKTDYDRHILTKKHVSKMYPKMETKKTTEFLCSHCNKIYKNRTGLWKHNKKCNFKE